jgi:hypothetical protein
MMNYSDPFHEDKLNKLRLMVYLVPIVGSIPALWTLYQHQGSREARSLSRLSVTLTLSWLIVYLLLWTGSSLTPETYTLRLLYLNGLLTSGYLLLSLGLMLRLWQGKLFRVSN